MAWRISTLACRIVLILSLLQTRSHLIGGFETKTSLTEDKKLNMSASDRVRSTSDIEKTAARSVGSGRHMSRQDFVYSFNHASVSQKGDRVKGIGLVAGGSKVDIEDVNDKASQQQIPPFQFNVMGNGSSTRSKQQSCVHVSHECVLNVSSRSVTKFRHIVYYGQYSFVSMNLVYPSDVIFKADRNIVGQNLWVWTYYGKKGSLEFLNWPVEFGEWSMGLLNTYALGPLDIEMIRVKGDCKGLQVGNVTTDRIISEALKSLTEAMMSLDKEQYGPSFWCYKRRMIINPEFLYKLCLHVTCPLEALKYKCCSYFYEAKCGQRFVSCRPGKFEFQYDAIWWFGPILIAILLFAFSPILLMWLSWKVFCQFYKIATKTQSEDESQFEFRNFIRDQPRESLSNAVVYLNGTSHVTLLGTLFKPLIGVCRKRPSLSSRLLRSLLPFLSLSIVAIQILLDNAYLHGYVLESVNKGVPLGFRSMLAGYTASRTNFLPYLGGPFVACGIYILLTELFLVLPKSMAAMLLSGLKEPDLATGLSPLFLAHSVVERFGSVPIQSRNNYHKLYSLYLAQFFMLLNWKFWAFLVGLQQERWERFQFSRPVKCLLVFPFIVTCILELLLCVIVYGLPVMSFMLTVTRAYCMKLYVMQTRTRIWIFAGHLLTLFLIVTVLYFMFMFCTIFLDAFLFIARVLTFTYTGIIVYPKVTYGYLIFAFTVLYYLWDCFQNFSQCYKQLLRTTINACQSVQRANDSEPLVIRNGDLKGIRSKLFEHVIELHMPRRKQVFLSMLKVILILGILGLSLNLLVKTDNFRELHVIMHVGTALFICACPKILKSMCSDMDDKFRYKNFKKELESTIRQYLGYFVELSDATDTE